MEQPYPFFQSTRETVSSESYSGTRTIRNRSTRRNVRSIRKKRAILLMWASTAAAAAACVPFVQGTRNTCSRRMIRHAVPAFTTIRRRSHHCVFRNSHLRPTKLSRFASSIENSSHLQQQEPEHDHNDDSEQAQSQSQPPLLDPSDFVMELPKSLSPSAAMEFKKCPQSYLFQYIYKLKQPTNQALVKGSMCHEALEQIFDLPPQDRTLENLQNLFRCAWAKIRNDEPYQHLFDTSHQQSAVASTTDNDDSSSGQGPSWDIQQEIKWGKEALQLLENYIQIEDPSLIEHPNPHKREMWLHQHLTLDPTQGVTGYTAPTLTVQGNNNNANDNGSVESTTPSTFYVRGIVDRLDMIRLPSSPQQVGLRIVDYKTGKAPNLKYSPRMNEEIAEEAFYQLKIYALLLREREAKLKHKNGNSTFSTTAATPLLPLQSLRLLYLNSESGTAQYLDMDLGETQYERDIILQEIHQDLAKVWTDIQELVQTQNPKAFQHCDRKFCYCHTCRPKFIPGTLAE